MTPHDGDGNGTGNGNGGDAGGSGSRLLVAFRRTRRQAVGRGLFVGAVTGVLLFGASVIVVVVKAATTGGTFPDESLDLLGALVLPVAAATAIGLIAGVRTGVDADNLGIHSVPPSPRTFAPWPAIVDMRAEHRRGKTVVSIYLESGAVLRLRAPYDGQLLGHDPRFERKYFALLNLWETHRTWRNRS